MYRVLIIFLLSVSCATPNKHFTKKLPKKSTKYTEVKKDKIWKNFGLDVYYTAIFEGEMVHTVNGERYTAESFLPTVRKVDYDTYSSLKTYRTVKSVINYTIVGVIIANAAFIKDSLNSSIYGAILTTVLGTYFFEKYYFYPNVVTDYNSSLDRAFSLNLEIQLD